MQTPRTLNQECLPESDQVDDMNIVLDVVNEFDGQIMETDMRTGPFFQSQTPTRGILAILSVYKLQKCGHKY